jgi:hypothetical protein
VRLVPIASPRRPHRPIAIRPLVSDRRLEMSSASSPPSAARSLPSSPSSSSSSSDEDSPGAAIVSDGPLSESEGPRGAAGPGASSPTSCAAASASSSSSAAAASLPSQSHQDEASKHSGSTAAAPPSRGLQFGGDLLQIARERTRRQDEEKQREAQLRGVFAARRISRQQQQQQRVLPASSDEEKSDESELSSSFSPPLRDESSFRTPVRPSYLPSSSSSSASASMDTSSSSSEAASVSGRPLGSALYPQAFAGPSPTPYAFASFARPGSSDPAAAAAAGAGRRFAPPAAQLTESALRMHTEAMQRGRRHSDGGSCTSSCSHAPSSHSHGSRSCSCSGSTPPATPPCSDDDYSICSCSLATESDSEFGSDCSDCSEGELEANLVISHELAVNFLGLFSYIGNPITWMSGALAGEIRNLPEYLGWVQRKLPRLPRWKIHPSSKPLKDIRKLDGETSQRVTAILQPAGE